MGKKKGSAGQRAKKKQAKEQKRKKALAKRGPGAGHYPHEDFAQRPKEIVWKPSRDGILGLAHLQHSTFIDAVYAAEHMGCVECGAEELPEQLWSRAKVNRLSTPEILERLAGFDVPVDQDRFVEGTRGFSSAMAYARETWLPLVPRSANVHARDLVYLAASELWVRWRPETPSQEMLLEPLLLGMDCYQHEKEASALRHWIRFWTTLAPLLPSEMRTLEDVEERLGRRRGALFVWLANFMSAAAFAFNDDRDLALQSIATCEEIRDRFSDGPHGTWLSLAEGALLLHEEGERDEAERILRKEIAAYPGRAEAYVTLADCWADADDADREEVARAVGLLEQAAAVPVEDGEEWLLSLHIEELRVKLSATR